MAKIGVMPLADLPLNDYEKKQLKEHKKAYIFPQDMTYEQWKKVFADGGSKDGLPYLEYIDDERVVLHDGNA